MKMKTFILLIILTKCFSYLIIKPYDITQNLLDSEEFICVSNITDVLNWNIYNDGINFTTKSNTTFHSLKYGGIYSCSDNEDTYNITVTIIKSINIEMYFINNNSLLCCNIYYIGYIPPIVEITTIKNISNTYYNETCIEITKKNQYNNFICNAKLNSSAIFMNRIIRWKDPKKIIMSKEFTISRPTISTISNNNSMYSILVVVLTLIVISIIIIVILYIPFRRNIGTARQQYVRRFERRVT